MAESLDTFVIHVTDFIDDYENKIHLSILNVYLMWLNPKKHFQVIQLYYKYLKAHKATFKCQGFFYLFETVIFVKNQRKFLINKLLIIFVIFN